MQIKIVSLENEMDVRVESLIAQIHKYRDKYVDKLRSFKAKFEKSDSNLSEVQIFKNTSTSYLTDWLINLLFLCQYLIQSISKHESKSSLNVFLNYYFTRFQ